MRGMINKTAYLQESSGERPKMELNNLKPAERRWHAKRRVGRGIGSGLGKTAGRGHKGQKSRAVEAQLWSVSKAVRCRCNVDFPSVIRFPLRYNAERSIFPELAACSTWRKWICWR